MPQAAGVCVWEEVTPLTESISRWSGEGLKMTYEEQRKALLHLASAVERVVTALERVKPECIEQRGTLLTGSFQDDLARARTDLSEMLKALGAWKP